MSERLRILMVLHMPWDRNLGGARVQLELAEEFTRKGHGVEKFDLFDAFGGSPPSRLAALWRAPFHQRATHFVRENASRFDVIDAHQGNLPCRKQDLGFRGLLVSRSVGLYAFYDEFARYERRRWPETRGSLPGRMVRGATRLLREPDYRRSLEACDLITVPNHDEYEYVRDELGLGEKCRVIPFGLTPERCRELAAVSEATPAGAGPWVAFVGAWGPRKGSRDWGTIVRQVRATVPEAGFVFLGTHSPPERVLRDLGQPPGPWLRIVPRYESAELPRLLRGCTAGAFPTYIEGFPFAVLEKLAAGLPTVAYDVPGPRESLRLVDPSLLVPRGNPSALAGRLSELLREPAAARARRARSCREVAQQFCWGSIAHETLAVYRDGLARLGAGYRVPQPAAAEANP
jgi:glycosyltransferase involved in cell wall biosynthesis